MVFAADVTRLFGALSIDRRAPQTGLLVSNHLSYPDIPCARVVDPGRVRFKSEVKNWPVFGWFASLAGEPCSWIAPAAATCRA